MRVPVFPMVFLFLTIPPAMAATPTLTLVNAGESPMTAVAFAPTGTDRWFSMAGGSISAYGKGVVALPGSACVFDVRFRFEDKVTMTVKAWNACKNPVMEIGRKVTTGGASAKPA
ncbi:hypothetical protein [Luteibacter sp.]|uniref:hypothetical protein n=1 Tax=Luteibacter sp. TaxID=1886636 RepID=UPI0028069996|nr:hypothetical protein [Luteibacter sp.]MDQ8048093.1 hypothetical protein [Luteibacter sp.]